MAAAAGGEARRRTKYPVGEPFEEGDLRVSSKEEGDHVLHYKLFGSQTSNKVAVYLHGGPGAGTSNGDAGYFSPEWKVVVFDQRGCGKSTPHGSLSHNTTWDLVEDIEKLRTHLGVTMWGCVFGGSWGSTLALAYAETHPVRVGSLVLRGIFLFDKPAMEWLFEQGGASDQYPQEWERYAGHIPAAERSLSLLNAYYRRVASDDMEVALPAAREFVRWELSISVLNFSREKVDELCADDAFALPFARAETHFFVHGGWFMSEEEEAQQLEEGETPAPTAQQGPGCTGGSIPYLLRHASRIRNIPTAIVHGRQDIVCRPRAAWELYKRLDPALATIEFVHDAGHSAGEPGTADGLVRATDRMLSATLANKE